MDRVSLASAQAHFALSQPTVERAGLLGGLLADFFASAVYSCRGVALFTALFTGPVGSMYDDLIERDLDSGGVEPVVQ